MDRAQERAAAPRRLWTWANALSLVRLALVVPLVEAIGAGRALAATAVLALAIATDFADGAVARRYGETSPLGGLLDHATDATFVTAGLAALAAAGVVPWPLPPLVALAFVQYVLDSRTLAGRPLRASSLGRWNGILYFVMVCVPVVRDALGWSWPGPGLVRSLGWALVASTVLSMGDRLLALRRR